MNYQLSTMNYVCVVGSLVFDLVAKADTFPKVGQSVLGNFFGMFPGGKGANQSLQIAKLKQKVFLVGKVGDDFFGNKILKSLKSGGVNIGLVDKDKKTTTAIANIIVDKTGHNQIVMVPAANMQIKKEQINKNKNLIAKAKILLLQFEIPLEINLLAMQIAKKNKVKIILNPAPAKKVADNILKLADFITPNETELEIISEVKIKSLNSVEKGCEILYNKGIKNIIVTLGEKGCFLYNKNGGKLFKAFKVQAVDTTAAGDAFNGAFCVGLLNNEPLEKCIMLAQAAGALATTKYGAQPSLPSLREVNKFLQHRQKKGIFI